MESKDISILRSGLSVLMVSGKLNCSLEEALCLLRVGVSSCVILPFCGLILVDNCKGLKYNHGLYTQCESIVNGNERYCDRCNKQAQNSSTGKPVLGDIEDRAKCGVDYRDPKGKLSLPYANVAKKLGIKMETADAAAKALGWVIPECQKVLRESKRGRPSKRAIVSDSDSESNVVAKKKGRPAKKVKESKTLNQEDQIAALVAEAQGAQVTNSLKETAPIKAEKLAKKEATANLKAEKKAIKDAEKLAKKEATANLKAEKKAIKDAEKLAKKEATANLKAEKKAIKDAEKLAKKEATANLKAEKKAIKDAEKLAKKNAANLKAEKKAIKDAEKLAKKNAANLKAEKKAIKDADKLAKKNATDLKKETEAQPQLEEEEVIELSANEEDNTALQAPEETNEGACETPEETNEGAYETPEETNEGAWGTPPPEDEGIELSDKMTVDGVEYYHTTDEDGNVILFSSTGEPVGIYDAVTDTVQEADFDCDSDDDSDGDD